MVKNRALPRRILVVRMSAMGDVAMLPHAVGALKKAYPDVEVTVATRPLFRPFFEGLDIGFIPVDAQREYRGVKALRELSRNLRAKGIDAFADVHDVWRSRFLRLIMALHGVRTAHIRKDHLRKWLALSNRCPGGSYLKHTVIRYCDTFRALGFDFADPVPPVKVPRPDPLPELTGTRVGFAPFSAHAGKTCPEPLRRRIVELLSGRFDRVFIHSGKGAEAEFAREMARTYPNVTAVCDSVNGLGEEMNLISNMDCMVSMDSLAMHMASLTATPVVSIWGATHPKLGFLGYGFSPDSVVQADMKCRPCSTYGNRECRYGDYRCLHAIDPAEVLRRVESVIAAE